MTHTSEKTRIKQLQESVKTLTALVSYYRIRNNGTWMREATDRCEKAVAQADAEYREAYLESRYAKTKLPKTERELRIAQKELRMLTLDKKIQRLLKLTRKIKELQPHGQN